MDLQRLRFPDRLEVEVQVSAAAREVLVPSLLVQPLVENTLEHDLAAARGGHVRVTAHRQGDSLEIEVSDDGLGFDEVIGESSGSLGLANTRERLGLLYGDRGTLTCRNLPGGGGSVTIRIPWRTSGAEDSA